MAQLRCLWASDSQSTVKDGNIDFDLHYHILLEKSIDILKGLSVMAKSVIFMSCRHFPNFTDKIIEDPNLLYLLAVHFLHIPYHDSVDQVVQDSLVQFCDLSILADFCNELLSSEVE